MLLTKIEEKENKGNASLKSYKGKEQELKSFVIDTLKKIFSLQVINGEYIEDLLSEYKTK